jgi:hypothetical protein
MVFMTVAFHIFNMELPTAEAIAQAKLNPGGWVLVVDHYSGPADKVPLQRIRGAWKVDEEGNITGDLVANALYRPIEECN